MGRIYPIASFETIRCIGIVRTMIIFEHLMHLKICVMRCFGIASFPITVRVNEGQQYIHLSEYAALQCPICALCYLHSLGAAPCFLHQVTPANAVMHLVGGMDGTGGLIILGTIAAESEVTIEAVKWIVVHVLDNQQA